MLSERSSGVLLHVTSLASYGGVGDFGPEAYHFVDFLFAGAAAVSGRCCRWLRPGTGLRLTPALSAFAGNPIFISLEILAEQGWIAAERIQGLPGHDGPADYGRANSEKLPLIEEAAANFLDRASDEQRVKFQRFCTDNLSWLADYAMFTVLRQQFGYASWHEWPAEYAQRKGDALARLMNDHGRELAVEQAVQYIFSEQWTALRAYACERKIQILGDVAIFVNYDSADVWTTPGIFELDEDLRPLRVSGVPPDYFSATGQTMGESALPVGCAEGSRVRLVGGADSAGADTVRRNPAGSLSRF